MEASAPEAAGAADRRLSNANAGDAEYDAALAAQARELRGQQIASQIKAALEKASVRTVELFRDWDTDGNGVIDKKEFEKAIMGLGVKATKEEISDLFERWDTDKSGAIDFKEMDRAIKSAKALLQKANASAKDIQKAIRDKLGRQAAAKDPSKPKPKGNLGGAIADAAAASTKPDKKEKSKKELVDEEVEENKWNVAQWLESLGLHQVIADAMDLPEAGAKQYNHIRRLQREKLEEQLAKGDLISKICDVVMGGVDLLSGGGGKLLDGAIGNDKFQTNAKFQMSYGSLSLFYGGLESLLGPPKMFKGSLISMMENEHTAQEDSTTPFETSNGATSTSAVEWEIIYCPKTGKTAKANYPERAGLREFHPEWCRKIVPLEEMMEAMENEANARLRKDGHTEMIIEELVGGRLYTGPCYAKYNAVLRAKSKDPPTSSRSARH